ncbi:hypothetical protein D3C87_1784120 [compost metagenome]
MPKAPTIFAIKDESPATVKGILASPFPPGSFSLNAFKTITNSSSVVGIFSPTLSSQSCRMYKSVLTVRVLLVGMAYSFPSTLAASKASGSITALMFGPYLSISGPRSTNAPFFA